jgi:hypothetical protein
MAEDDAVDGSMTDSTILVIVKSLSAGRKFFTPLIRESKFEDSPDGTPVSFKRSVRREDMDEKRPNRSDEEACWFELLFMVVSCVIFVVARTLSGVSDFFLGLIS